MQRTETERAEAPDAAAPRANMGQIGLFRRRRYIVDWKLQGSLIAYGLVYGALVLAAIGLGIFAPLLWGLGDPSRPGGFEERSIVMLYMHDRFWLIAAVSLVIAAVGAVRHSHRVAGPMVRFKRNLRLMADGKLPPPLRTRRSDFLKDEVGALNEAVAGISARVDEVRRAQASLARSVHEVLDTRAELAPELRKVDAACDQLARAVQNFEHVDTRDDLSRPYEAASASPIGQPGGA